MTAGKRKKRSDRFLGTLDEYDDTVVIMHNNPDPDAIATGWAVLTLVNRRLRKPVRLVGRGPILRAENLEFVKLLQPPIELLDEIHPGGRTATVLVDCAPASLNHLLGGRRAPTAVIDHHESKKDGFRIPFRDLRPRVTASASIAAEYMREQEQDPTPEMATALVYAIRTEMIGARKALSQLDHSALRWLSGFADYDVLSNIENPPLPQQYYKELHSGLESVFVFADTAVCFIPRISAPEIVGELADLLIRYAGLQTILCAGWLGGDLLFSARSKGGDRTALSMLSQVVDGLGHSGGHLHRAGGIIKSPARGRPSPSIEKDMTSRWLDAYGSTMRRGRRLVAADVVE